MPFVLALIFFLLTPSILFASDNERSAPVNFGHTREDREAARVVGERFKKAEQGVPIASGAGSFEDVVKDLDRFYTELFRKVGYSFGKTLMSVATVIEADHSRNLDSLKLNHGNYAFVHALEAYEAFNAAAKESKELNLGKILMPLSFEGYKRIEQAIQRVIGEEVAKVNTQANEVMNQTLRDLKFGQSPYKQDRLQLLKDLSGQYASSEVPYTLKIQSKTEGEITFSVHQGGSEICGGRDKKATLVGSGLGHSEEPMQFNYVDIANMCYIGVYFYQDGAFLLTDNNMPCPCELNQERLRKVSGK